MEWRWRARRPIDKDPDCRCFDVGAAITSDLGASLCPSAPMTAAPCCEPNPFLKNRCLMHLEHHPTHHPAHRFGEPGIGRIISSDILQVPNRRIEAAAAGRIDIAEPNPTSSFVHAPNRRLRGDHGSSLLRHEANIAANRAGRSPRLDRCVTPPHRRRQAIQ